MEEIAFPRLSPDHLALVARLGQKRSLAPGDVLIATGERQYPFCVVLSGSVNIVDLSSGSPRLVTRHGPASFIGDVDILTGRPAVISALAHEDSEVLVVPAAEVRRLLNEVPDLSDLLLEAFQTRREMLRSSPFQGVRLIGEPRTPAVLGIREFFYKNHVPHTLFDPNEPEGAALMQELGISPEALPALACSGLVNRRPTLEQIAGCLGIRREIDDVLYDLIVVGAGPAGLAATVYAASEGLRTLVIDRVGPGGQAGSSSRIENFMGFPAGISGAELANRAYLQALKFGAEFTAPVSVKAVRPGPEGEHLLDLCTGQTARARCVLAATGVTYRHLDAMSGRPPRGEGIYYSATTVEARLCRQARAVVVGAGNSAGQAAMYLAEHAREVKLVVRGDDLGKSMSAYLCNRIQKHPRIEVLLHHEVQALEGADCLEGVTLLDRRTNTTSRMECAALFIFIGAQAHTDWLPETVRRDAKGYLLTGVAAGNDPLWPLDRAPCDLETTVPGILAAGDIRSGTTKRCGFAVGDGSLAITCVHRYLGGLA
jgi:thioredoxin reductase (NADPH)